MCRQSAQGGFRKRQEAKRRWYTGLRAKIFGHYGWSCACCGAAENPTIDHIDGNGRAHRIELFGSPNSSGAPFWSWLIKNGLPEGFQTLCSRCNNAKGAGLACPLHPPSSAPAKAAA
jgi:hypothetical protein